MVFVALATLPFALALLGEAVAPVVPDARAAYLGWSAYFAGLNLAATGLSLLGVLVFYRLTPTLDRALTDSGRSAYDRWADVWTSTWPQVIFGLTGAFGACWALWVASAAPEMQGVLPITVASYISASFSGFFVAGGIYWIVAGTVLSIPLTRPGRMILSWVSPVTTPAVELLARCYRLAFNAACLGVALCLIPILMWAYGAEDSSRLQVVKMSLFVLALAATLAIAVVPQWRLSRLVARERRCAFQAISEELPQRPSDFRADGRSEPLLSWLQTVASSRSTTISESAIVGIVLGLATALAPYLLRFVGG